MTSYPLCGICNDMLLHPKKLVCGCTFCLECCFGYFGEFCPKCKHQVYFVDYEYDKTSDVQAAKKYPGEFFRRSDKSCNKAAKMCLDSFIYASTHFGTPILPIEGLQLVRDDISCTMKIHDDAHMSVSFMATVRAPEDALLYIPAAAKKTNNGLDTWALTTMATMDKNIGGMHAALEDMFKSLRICAHPIVSKMCPSNICEYSHMTTIGDVTTYIKPSRGRMTDVHMFVDKYGYASTGEIVINSVKWFYVKLVRLQCDVMRLQYMEDASHK